MEVKRQLGQRRRDRFVLHIADILETFFSSIHFNLISTKKLLLRSAINLTSIIVELVKLHEEFTCSVSCGEKHAEI